MLAPGHTASRTTRHPAPPPSPAIGRFVRPTGSGNTQVGRLEQPAGARWTRQRSKCWIRNSVRRPVGSLAIEIPPRPAIQPGAHRCATSALLRHIWTRASRVAFAAQLVRPSSSGQPALAWLRVGPVLGRLRRGLRAGSSVGLPRAPPSLGGSMPRPRTHRLASAPPRANREQSGRAPACR